MVKVGNEEVLLVNVDGDIHACDDICTHSYASLSEGDLSGTDIECPLHGALFNVTTGEVITPPATLALRVFQVRIDGQDILVGPPAA
jgi:nitrite reductase/ring-hydroxylating ferredoxin subunit